MKLVLHPTSIFGGREYYRLITADFVHIDLAHLLLNEVMLFYYCANLEQYLNRSGHFGSGKFLLIYLGSCLTGSFITAWRHRKDFGYSSAGASGSILGCMISYTILRPNILAFYLPFIGPVNNLFFGLIVIVGLVIYQRRTKSTLLNHEVHFFGGLGGIVTTLLLFPGLL